MSIKSISLLSGALLFSFSAVLAQEKPGKDAEKISNKAPETQYHQADNNQWAKYDPPKSVTKHSVTINGKNISYTATVGYTILHDENGKALGKVFSIAYTKDGEPDAAKRPVTFAYNGGPGSASLWVHMGALGPRRIRMQDSGEAEEPPYTVVDNEYSWLDKTDLVFIDPIETGYSRPAEGIDKKIFTGYEEDIQSVGDFIRLWTSRNGRWGSQKFLAGESYGTTRSAGLSGYLSDRYGYYLNGIVLISSILNFQTAQFNIGNDLPYPLFLPTYAAIAWYHKKIDPKYKDLRTFLKEVEEFSLGEYSTALMKGDKLTDAEVESLAIKLATYTGLSKQYIINTNLRIVIFRFVKELRRNEGLVVGRLDGRFTGHEYDNAGERFASDPSNNEITGPYAMAINSYVKKELNYENDLPYEVLSGFRVRPWNYNNVQNQYLNVAETLRSAMTKNPSLKVTVLNGYYDLATPYFATQYTFDHMYLPKELRKNITMSFYEAGHMMYIHKPSLVDMKKNVGQFYDSFLSK
ncbi:peptidase S10 [Dyadobacter luteus]|uniref:Peptidase S10 n=1 Tax=Dyadobacter luteus TaxID=2259619 RepID=A0A3D8YBP7_9BACT|nr:peptidase S10 [Dyadobacter luteus]REA60871.1 peptidase S10 [Dyadobacter luteus]